jgi:cell division protein FtsB
VSLLTSILIINALIGEQGVIAVMRARAERTTLETVMNSLQKENYELRQLAVDLRTDPSTIERIARDDLGLISPGEQVLIIGKPRNSDQIAPTR